MSTAPTHRICSRCIFTEETAGISINETGLCNLCQQTDELVQSFGTAMPSGERWFSEKTRQIAAEGSQKKYDCIVGVSGGTDSSYLLHELRHRGLRPLAVHYDNTWNSGIASENMSKVLHALDVDLFTYVVDNREMDDIYRSFFLAGVPELEASTDLGYAYLLRLAAKSHSVKYVIEGHSYLEEGVTPLNSNYFDGRYIREIHRRFGKIPITTYPLMTLRRFLAMTVLQDIEFVRPFWRIAYRKRDARELLTNQYGWQYYGGHHLENRMTSFLHSVYLPQKFGVDMRINSFAAQARNGTISRDQALEAMRTPTSPSKDVEVYFRERLELSEETYQKVMNAEPRNWTEYPTYKRHFKALRPLFRVLTDAGRVPDSFYRKYCF